MRVPSFPVRRLPRQPYCWKQFFLPWPCRGRPFLGAIATVATGGPNRATSEVCTTHPSSTEPARLHHGRPQALSFEHPPALVAAASLRGRPRSLHNGGTVLHNGGTVLHNGGTVLHNGETAPYIERLRPATPEQSAPRADAAALQ